mmetsp:Transcript_10746/g.31699  ORF Transcript_10746/g.31699 Transcript_10746/m.31699 type:complete len:237 (+) Transcript_10746:1317-2027(+)
MSSEYAQGMRSNTSRLTTFVKRREQTSRPDDLAYDAPISSPSALLRPYASCGRGGVSSVRGSVSGRNARGSCAQPIANALDDSTTRAAPASAAASSTRMVDETLFISRSTGAASSRPMMFALSSRSPSVASTPGGGVREGPGSAAACTTTSQPGRRKPPAARSAVCVTSLPAMTSSPATTSTRASFFSAFEMAAPKRPATPVIAMRSGIPAIYDIPRDTPTCPDPSIKAHRGSKSF